MNRDDRRQVDKTYRNLTRRPPKDPPDPYRGSQLVDEILDGMRGDQGGSRREIDVSDTFRKREDA